ncbi:MAG: phage portal protein, partial [Shewanella sp.]
MNRLQKMLLRASGMGKQDILELEIKRKSGEPIPLVGRSTAGRAQYQTWDSAKAVSDGMKSSTWVYACVRRIYENAASVPFVLEQKRGNDFVKIGTHEIIDVLERPSKNYSMDYLTSMALAHLNLTGNALWHVISVGPEGKKRPYEFQILKPSETRVLPGTGIIGDANEKTKYEITRAGLTKQILESSEVIHWMLPDPENLLWGLAPLQAAARVVDTDIAAQRWNKNVIDNRGVTDYAFVFKDSLTKPQFELAREQVREQIATKGREPWVLGNGDVRSFGSTAVDLDYANLRKLSREEIAAAFGVPLILLGVLEGATYANLEIAKRLFWEDVIIPMLEAFCDTLTRVVCLPFEPKPLEQTLRIRPDFSGVPALQENFNTR